MTAHQNPHTIWHPNVIKDIAEDLRKLWMYVSETPETSSRVTDLIEGHSRVLLAVLYDMYTWRQPEKVIEHLRETARGGMDHKTLLAELSQQLILGTEDETSKQLLRSVNNVKGKPRDEWSSLVLDHLLGMRTAKNVQTMKGAEVIWWGHQPWGLDSDNIWHPLTDKELHATISLKFSECGPIADKKGKPVVQYGDTPSARLVSETAAIMPMISHVPASKIREQSEVSHSIDLITGKKLAGACFKNGRLFADSHPLIESKDWILYWRDGHSRRELWYGPRKYEHTPYKHDSADINKVVSKLRYDAPHFHRYITSITRHVDKETEKRNLQQRIMEMIGMFGLNDTRNQRAWILSGPGGTGKSVMQSLLSHISGGDDGAYSTRYERLSEKYAESRLIGKSALIVQEMSERPTDASKAEWDRAASLIKAVTGDDSLSARYMYQQDTPQVLLALNVCITCNTLPNFVSRPAEAVAWKRRMLPVPYQETISTKDNIPDLKTMLQAEAAAIVSAGIAVYTKPGGAWRTNQFATTSACDQALRLATRLRNDDLYELLERDPGGEISGKEIARVYEALFGQTPTQGQIGKYKADLIGMLGCDVKRKTSTSDVLDGRISGYWYQGVNWKNTTDVKNLISGISERETGPQNRP